MNFSPCTQAASYVETPTRSPGKRPFRCSDEDTSEASTPKRRLLEKSECSTPMRSVPSPSILIVGTDRKGKGNRVSFAKKLEQIRRFDKERESPPETSTPIAESVKIRRRNSLENPKTAEERSRSPAKKSEKEKKTPARTEVVGDGEKSPSLFPKIAIQKRGRPPGRRKNALLINLNRRKSENIECEISEDNETRRKKADSKGTKGTKIIVANKKTAEILKCMKAKHDDLKKLYHEPDSFDETRVDEDYAGGNCEQNPEIRKLRLNFSRIVNKLLAVDMSYRFQKLYKDRRTSTAPKKKVSGEEEKTVCTTETRPSDNVPGPEAGDVDSIFEVLEQEILENFQGEVGANHKSPPKPGADLRSPPKRSTESIENGSKAEDDEPRPSTSENSDNIGEAIFIWDGLIADRDVDEDDNNTVIFDENDGVETASASIPSSKKKFVVRRRYSKFGLSKSKPRASSVKTGKKIRFIKIKRREKESKKKGNKRFEEKRKSGSPKENKIEKKETVDEGKFTGSLKGISNLVKELHEKHQLILSLEKLIPEKPELSDHSKPVISSLRADYRKYIDEHKSTILKVFDETVPIYGNHSKVHLVISKMAQLTSEQVSQVISSCMVVEDVPVDRSETFCPVPVKPVRRDASPVRSSPTIEVSQNSGGKKFTSKPEARVLPTKAVSSGTEAVSPMLKDVYEFVPSEDESSGVKRLPDSSHPSVRGRGGCGRFHQTRKSTTPNLPPAVLTYFVAPTYLLEPQRLQTDFVPTPKFSAPVLPAGTPVARDAILRTNGTQCRKTMPTLYAVRNYNGARSPTRRTYVKIATDQNNQLKFVPVPGPSEVPSSSSFDPNRTSFSGRNSSVAKRPARSSLPVQSARPVLSPNLRDNASGVRTDFESFIPENRIEKNRTPPTEMQSQAENDHPYAFPPSKRFPRLGGRTPIARSEPPTETRKISTAPDPDHDGSARTNPTKFENVVGSRLSVPPSPKAPDRDQPGETSMQRKALAQLIELNKQLVEMRKVRRSSTGGKRSRSTNVVENRNDTPVSTRKTISPRSKQTDASKTERNFSSESPDGPSDFVEKPFSSSRRKAPTSSVSPAGCSPGKKSEEKSPGKNSKKIPRRAPKKSSTPVVEPKDGTSPFVDLSRVKMEKENFDAASTSGFYVKREMPSPDHEEQGSDEESSTDDEPFFDLDKVKKELEDDHGVIHFICAENKCMKSGTKICTGCQSVLYCSRKCQAKHWDKKHHRHCQQLRQQAEERKRARSTRNDEN